jgi:hypothetical protein
MWGFQFTLRILRADCALFLGFLDCRRWPFLRKVPNFCEESAGFEETGALFFSRICTQKSLLCQGRHALGHILHLIHLQVLAYRHCPKSRPCPKSSVGCVTHLN